MREGKLNPNYRGGICVIKGHSRFSCVKCQSSLIARRNGRCRDCWKIDMKVPENHPRFGQRSKIWSYKHLHKRINEMFGKPTKCEHCGKEKAMDWANKSGKYTKERGDWMRLCRRCHCLFDRKMYLGGSASRYRERYGYKT